MSEEMQKTARMFLGDSYRFFGVNYTPIYWDGLLIAEWQNNSRSWYASDNGLSFEHGFGHLYKLLQMKYPRTFTIYYPTYSIDELETVLHYYDVKLKV